MYIDENNKIYNSEAEYLEEGFLNFLARMKMKIKAKLKKCNDTGNYGPITGDLMQVARTASSTKEVRLLKKDLKGGYTYGLNYFIKLKAKSNKDYMSDGIDSNGTPTRISNSNDAESVYFYNVVPKSTIRGPRLISTSYSAKEQGLKAKNRIVEINDKHIKKYTPEELWTLLNPTKAGQTIKVGYKEKSGGKVKHVTLESKYQKPILENL